MISNGPSPTSLKGHIIDLDNPSSVPTFFNNWSQERREKEAAAFNERYKIIETCKLCHEPLITEDALAHKMNHIPSRSRALVRTIIALDVDTRKEVLDAVQGLI